jgi:hypothetical protein
MNHDNRHLHNRRFLNGYVYLVALVLCLFSHSTLAAWGWAGSGAIAGSKKYYDESMDTSIIDAVADCTTAVNATYTDRPNYVDITGSTIRKSSNSYGFLYYYARCEFVNYVYTDYSCADGQTVVYPNNECVSDPDYVPTYTCVDIEVQKEFQNSQYACQLGNPNTQIYDTNFDYYCEDVTGQEYPNVSTSCSYTPNSCIVGLDCPTASDDPVCNPATDDCTLPEPNPDTVPDENPEIPVTDPEFCDLNPDVCDRPDVPAVEPDPIPNPEDSAKPDSPDLDAGFNALVKETSISNNHLTNVNSNIQELNRDVNSLLNKNNVLSQHQLGALKDIAKKIDQNGKNEASTDLHLSQMNAKLEDIKCLLDENCEADGKEKPTANVDCQASIFECKGDVIQCAMLKLQYENTCAADDLEKLEAAFAAHTGLDPAASIVQADEIDLSKIDSRYLDNGVSFGAAQCPAPLAIRHDFGFAGKLDTEFSFEPACEYARLINPLILVFAWLSGLYIIGRTQGVLS